MAVGVSISVVHPDPGQSCPSRDSKMALQSLNIPNSICSLNAEQIALQVDEALVKLRQSSFAPVQLEWRAQEVWDDSSGASVSSQEQKNLRTIPYEMNTLQLSSACADLETIKKVIEAAHAMIHQGRAVPPAYPILGFFLSCSIRVIDKE